MRTHYFLLLFLLQYYFICNAKVLFIIVPGTWSSNQDWYYPQGDFFKALSESPFMTSKIVVSYHWSGKNNHNARLTAAYGLAAVIRSYPPETLIYIVSHSHGTNVAILASHILKEQTLTQKTIPSRYVIQAIIGLGTPIHKFYFPNMDIIKAVYNLFSFDDFIQPVFGMFERVYPQHPRIANIAIKINDKEPQHTELHDNCIATWLPTILDRQTSCIKNFALFSFTKPGIIHFYHDRPPEFFIDNEREENLFYDRILIEKYTQALIKNRYEHIKPNAHLQVTQ